MNLRRFTSPDCRVLDGDCRSVRHVARFANSGCVRLRDLQRQVAARSCRGSLFGSTQRNLRSARKALSQCRRRLCLALPSVDRHLESFDCAKLEAMATKEEFGDVHVEGASAVSKAAEDETAADTHDGLAVRQLPCPAG